MSDGDYDAVQLALRDSTVERLRKQLAEREASLRTLSSQCVHHAAALVRVVGPDDLPQKWADLIDREPVVEVALALRRDADAARVALARASTRRMR